MKEVFELVKIIKPTPKKAKIMPEKIFLGKIFSVYKMKSEQIIGLVAIIKAEWIVVVKFTPKVWIG